MGIGASCLLDWLRGRQDRSAPNDSGFTVLFSDAPDPEEVDDSVAHPDIGLVHLHHLLEEDPGLARGLDIAFEYGVADLDEHGEWMVGELSWLDDG